MLGYNKVMLMGHVTRDPELRQLPGSAESPTALAEFGLACNRRYRTAGGEDREDTLFIECTVFGKPADVVARYVKKGKPLFVEGRLRYDAWEDNDGQKRSKISVVVDQFQFVGPRDEPAPKRPRPVKVAQADIPF